MCHYRVIYIYMYGAAWWIFNEHLRAGSEVHEPWPRRSKISETVPFIRRVPLLFPDRSQTEETEADGSILTCSFSLSLSLSLSSSLAKHRSAGKKPAIHELIAMVFPFIEPALSSRDSVNERVIRVYIITHTHTCKGTINSSNAAGVERYRTNEWCVWVCVQISQARGVDVATAPPTPWFMAPGLCTLCMHRKR